MEIMRDVYSSIGNSEHSKAMASHRSKNSTYEKIPQIFFWCNISNYINEFVKKCEQCQKQGDVKSPKADLKPVPIPSTVMKQVIVDIWNRPEADGYCHIIVLNFSFFKMVGSKANQRQIYPNCCSIFVWSNVSSWMFWCSNQQSRSRVCQSSMRWTPQTKRSWTESDVCMSPSG